MKQIDKNTLCYKCLGCNKLELEEFQGTNYCKNTILVDRIHIEAETTEAEQSIPIMSKKVQQAILDIKENLGIIKTVKGEQIKL